MPTREDFKSFASAGFATRALWKQLYSLHLRYMPAFGVVVDFNLGNPACAIAAYLWILG